MSLSRDEILARAPPAEPPPELEVVGRRLAERYSCRAFGPDPVPHETIERILALGQLTASWCNAQPWAVIVTEGAGTERFREALFRHAVENAAVTEPDLPFPTRYEGVYGERRREAGWALYDSLGVAKGDRAGAGRQMLENYRLFGAPHVLFVTSEADLGPYGVLDCGIYLGNLMTLMQSAGLASIAQGAFAKFAPFIRDYFAIPDHRRLVVGLSFGYPAEAHPVNGFRTRRAGLDAVAQWVTE